MKDFTERLGTAPVGRLLVKLSLPGMASSISTSLYNIINTIWVTRIGYEAIAALTIVMPFQIIFYAIGGGTGIGIAALVSRRFGEKKADAANRVAGQIFFLSLFWGIILMLVSTFFATPLLKLMGATPDIMDYSRQYLVTIAYGAPFVIFAIVVTSLLRGSGDVMRPMVIMIASTVINIILDPFLIFGIGPFPELGVTGAALGTVISQACGAGLGLYYIFSGKTAFHIKAAHILPSWTIIKDIYQVGAPSIILQITESFVFILWNVAVSSFGSVAIAAVGIVMRISDFAFMPVMGVQNGLLPIIGYCFGANLFNRLWSAVKKAMLGIMALLAVMTIAFEIWTPQIISIFTKDPELVKVALPAMRIMLSTMIFIGPSIITIATFQGLGKGTKAMILSMLRQFIVFVPLLFLFRALWGMTGVWACSPAADTIGVTISLLFLWQEYQKHRHAGLKAGPSY
jgi:putative MATE family efflux protein